MRKIYVADFTLRELEREKNSALLFREKTAAAQGIDRFGADAVELAEMKNVKEDTIIYKTIASSLQSKVCLPVGFSRDGVEKAWQCIKDAADPCLQVIVPVSTVTMEYTYHVKENKMLMKIEELCQAAAEKCSQVEFVAQDATRADREFLAQAVETAAEAGAGAVTICDDVGTALPEELAELVAFIKEHCSVPVYVQTSNQIRMGAAAAIAALCAGADGVKTAAVGETTLHTADLADILTARGESLGLCTSLKTTEIHRDISSLLKKVSRPVYESQKEAAAADAVFLDSESSLPQVCEAAHSLGYDLSDEDNDKVYKALMRVCERKSSVGARELEAIIASSAMQAPSTYHLESYVANSSNITASMAQVVLVRGEEKLTGVADGDGPIDAAFRAIEHCVGYHYELDDFQIQAVTEGKEALGSALVRLRSAGRLYSGNGLSTDIVGASIRAYVNALNKIAAEQEI